MLFRTDDLCFDQSHDAALKNNPSIKKWSRIGPDEVHVTYQWEEAFKIHPLDTSVQRQQYDADWEMFMGRGEAAGVFEVLAVNANQIERPLCIADAADRLACNACTKGYMPLIVEGFNKPDITIGRACRLLLEVSDNGSRGHWPDRYCTSWDDGLEPEATHDKQACDQFIREFGAAISILINPAWRAELRARLDLFCLMGAESQSRRLAIR